MRFVRRSSYFSPAHAGLFCARPSNAKGPVIRDGAFRTFLHWRGMLCDPADFSIRHALIWFPGRPVVAFSAGGDGGAEAALPVCGSEHLKRYRSFQAASRSDECESQADCQPTLSL